MAAELSTEPFNWSTADYEAWNRRLVEHFLFGASNQDTERLAASPEELAAAAHDPLGDSERIVEAFVSAVKAVLPKGRKTLCSFCCQDRGWTPESADLPHFFGVLWFTCLVAAGHPGGAGSFDSRFAELIGKRDNLTSYAHPHGCLDPLWQMLSDWTSQNARCGNLRLPPGDGWRTKIGTSYYLAFPNGRDRRTLTEILGEDDLLGLEPPILPVVSTILRGSKRFSPDFQEVLERFRTHYLRGGRDPVNSPFWRAIRSVALNENETNHKCEIMRGGMVSLIAWWDDDEMLALKLVTKEDLRLDETTTQKLPVAAGDYRYAIADLEGDSESLVRAALSDATFLPPGLPALLRQGVLVFQEDVMGDYRLAWGEEVNGADVALVREDLESVFLETFGGHSQASHFKGWNEVLRCEVLQLPALPPGLESARSLLHTTSAPKPRLAGAARVEGGYLWLPGIKPRIRIPEAVKVRASTEDDSVGQGCEPHDEPGEWHIPYDLLGALPTLLHVWADFEIELQGNRISRTSQASFRFVASGIGSDFKPAGSGSYWLESCEPEQVSHPGATPVDIGTTTAARNESADFLLSDDSIRWLGPALGQISERPRHDYPWVVRGRSSKPSDLVYIGDLKHPMLPSPACSSDQGDRRLWRRAFTTPTTRVHARICNAYLPPEAASGLVEVYNEYKRRAGPPFDDGRQCKLPPSQASSWAPPPPLPPTPHSIGTYAAVEATSALGVNRSGIPLREFQALLSAATGVEDLLARQQIVRAWTESGLIDLLRRKDRSQTVVVPRRPRFVMVRRGPTVDATLVGLAPGALVALLDARCRAKLHRLPVACPYVPHVVRLRDVTADYVEDLSSATGLGAPEWLRWPDADTAPSYLNVESYNGGIAVGAPPDAYVTDAEWDWDRRMFRSHFLSASDYVRVQRRRHPRRCSIYVLMLGGEEMAWCYLRSWALLRAAELRDDPPFELSVDGVIRAFGLSPMHLPLPLGRLCTILGKGVPGPRMLLNARLETYEYPFGEGLDEQVRSLLPRSWFSGPSRATRPATTPS